ncbi:MAG: LysR family transcriptional regulator [Proteobacteria bacterium]|nr:MAG: LysR family transcriptional regulator [Pseudomonadota bacterium]
MTINPNHVRAFHAVASHGSFSRAAAALHVTQPTLSGQVKLLEQRFGVKLFHRRKRGIELTEIGRQLHQCSTRIEHAEQEIAALLAREKREIAGKLSIGADAPYQIMPILASFKARHPAVSVSIKFGNSSWLLSGLKQGLVDVIIAPNLASRTRLHMLALAPDYLRVFVNADHPWQARSTIMLEDIEDQTVVLRELGSTTRAILDRALKRAGIRLKNTIEIGSREAVREAVAAGLGVSVVPDSERGDDHRFHFLEVRNAALSNTEYVACLDRNQQRPTLKSFFACCRDAAL